MLGKESVQWRELLADITYLVNVLYSSQLKNTSCGNRLSSLSHLYFGATSDDDMRRPCMQEMLFAQVILGSVPNGDCVSKELIEKEVAVIAVIVV